MVRDFSSSAASKESSAGEDEGSEGVCLDPTSHDLGPTWSDQMLELCSDTASTQAGEAQRTTVLSVLYAPSDEGCQQLGHQFPMTVVKVTVCTPPLLHVFT